MYVSSGLPGSSRYKDIRDGKVGAGEDWGLLGVMQVEKRDERRIG